jgi:ethanolamine utilization microcompartment shell protein EutS
VKLLLHIIRIYANNFFGHARVIQDFVPGLSSTLQILKYSRVPLKTSEENRFMLNIGINLDACTVCIIHVYYFNLRADFHCV